MALDKPIRPGDPIRAELFEEMRKAILQVLKVGGGLQMSHTGTGIFLTNGESPKETRIAKVDQDGCTARDGSVLGKGKARIYTSEKSSGVNPNTTITQGEVIDIVNYTSEEIDEDKWVLVTWSRGAGWIVTSEDCDQID